MRNKEITIFLLFVLYLSVCGVYLKYGETYNRAYLLGLVDFVRVSLALMIVPMILRIKNNKPFEYEEGRKICMNNSWLLFGISIILMLTNVSGFVGGLGALVYYYINMNITTKANPYAKHKSFKITSNKIVNETEKVDSQKLEETKLEDEEEYRKLLMAIKKKNDLGGNSNNNFSNYSNLDEIKKLKELLDIEAITKEEFEKKKKELLKSM